MKDFGGLDWSLSPLYSEADDGDLPRGSFGVQINHRDGYEQPDYAGIKDMYGQDGNNLRQLIQSGVIGEGEDDPDYIAGRFANVDDFNLATSETTFSAWDEGKGQYVLYGDQTEGSTYNPDTNTFDLPVVEVPKVDSKPGDIQIGADDWAGGGLQGLIEGVDYPDGWTYDYTHQEAVSPEGDRFDPLYESEYMWKRAQEIIDQADQNAQDKKDADDKAAEDDAQKVADAIEADAKAADKQKVPDDDPGVHEDPNNHPPTYMKQKHEVQHFSQDPTAPGHIPMGVIASQIQEGIKVI
jgi:hypothetical protein